MNSIAAVEVPSEFTLAAVESLGPFRWVLLHALRTFPRGSRPDFVTLTERLCLGERAFLDGAWASLVAIRAVDHDVFTDAAITVRGEEALARGCVLASPPETRKAVCYFAVDDGRCIETMHAVLTDLRALRSPPTWRDELTSTRLADALVRQNPQLAPRSDERILHVAPDWSAAREVRVTPRGAQ